MLAGMTFIPGVTNMAPGHGLSGLPFLIRPPASLDRRPTFGERVSEWSCFVNPQAQFN